MPEGLPILLAVRDKPCLIVGGGSVGSRKARQLVDLGADVHVQAPFFATQMPADVTRHVSTFRDTLAIDRPRLVIAATDIEETNDAVVAAGEAAGAVTLRADAGDAAASSLAATDVGPITIAATAGGAALSVAVRDHLADRLDRRYVTLARVMRELRRDAIDTLPPADRRALFRRLASDAALGVAGGGPAAVRDWLAAGG